MKSLFESIKESRKISIRGIKPATLKDEIESIFDGYSKDFDAASEIIYNLYKEQVDDFRYVDELISHIAETLEERAKELSDKDLQILRSALGNSALL